MVPSVRSQWICELGIIELLVDHSVIVICAGGGGISTARELQADALLMLTDADAVFEGWEQPQARAIRPASQFTFDALSFEPGSTGPKVETACEFVERTGTMAGIGRIVDALEILHG